MYTDEGGVKSAIPAPWSDLDQVGQQHTLSDGDHGRKLPICGVIGKWRPGRLGQFTWLKNARPAEWLACRLGIPVATSRPVNLGKPVVGRLFAPIVACWRRTWSYLDAYACRSAPRSRLSAAGAAAEPRVDFR